MFSVLHLLLGWIHSHGTSADLEVIVFQILRVANEMLSSILRSKDCSHFGCKSIGVCFRCSSEVFEKSSKFVVSVSVSVPLYNRIVKLGYENRFKSIILKLKVV